MYATIQDAEGQVQNTRKKRGWAGWRPVREVDRARFKMKVTGADRAEEGKSFEEIQKQIQMAAKAINFSTRAVRQNAENKIPDDVTKREGARDRLTDKF